VNSPDPEILKSIVREKMPFGKYEGRLISDIPVYYLEWFAQKGFPKGKLGIWLETTLEIKQNGLEELLFELKRRYGLNG
jgi:uncharacterized protein (DUF3820 family)